MLSLMSVMSLTTKSHWVQDPFTPTVSVNAAMKLAAALIEINGIAPKSVAIPFWSVND